MDTNRAAASDAPPLLAALARFAQLNLITDDREPGRFVLDSCRMLLTGTLANHAEQIAARLDRPDHPSIPHLAAPAAALGFAQHGDLERARQIASRWFAPPPRSWCWMQPIAYWARSRP